MAGRFALDIETVSPSLDHYAAVPDFGDPSHFELLAVALAHDAPGGEREVAVLFREGSDPGAELDLVERTCDWLAGRSGETVFTFGGDGFDVPQLVGRAEAAAAAVGDRAAAAALDDPAATAERIRRLLGDDLEHVDLQPSVWTAFGEYTSLDDACERVGVDPEPTPWAAYDHGLDLDDHRPAAEAGTEAVRNRDVPLVGERYLALADAGATETVTFGALRALLEDYAAEDVAHLFDIADARPFDGAAPADRG